MFSHAAIECRSAAPFFFAVSAEANFPSLVTGAKEVGMIMPCACLAQPCSVSVVDELVSPTSTLGFTPWRAISAARPKVADYPFTTLIPSLGVVRVDVNRSFVLADIPGLIEGASEGAGLGLQFLRHLVRTRLLLHLVDVAPLDAGDPVRDARAIVQELRKYDEALYRKPRWLVLNKIDLVPAGERERTITRFLRNYRWKGKCFIISALTGEGCRELAFAVMKHLEQDSGSRSQDSAKARRRKKSLNPES